MDSPDQPFPRSTAVITTGIADGLHPGAQLFIQLDGKVLIDTAFGESRAGVPMTRDSLNLWLSSTKPVAAIAIAQLWERGLLELDDRVVNHIPEFDQNGKGPITIRHILTHTCGFRTPPRNPEAPWESVIAEMCAARLEPGWVPGKKAGYHPASSWYILGELVRRLDGRPYDQYVRGMIFEPIGMRDCWIGMPTETYIAYGERIAPMHDTSKGAAQSIDPQPIATSCRPGSTGYGPIRELGQLYEMLRLRGSIAGHRIITAQSAEALTARHRAGMFDVTFKHNMDWGLGFLLNLPTPDAGLPYGYGPHASPRTYGHGGAGSSGAFCDPEQNLVVAYAFNGSAGEAKHHARRNALVTAIYEDLHLF